MLKRLGYSLFHTTFDFGGEILGLFTAPWMERILGQQKGLGRLASVRALTKTSVDGAVLEGADLQAWAKFTIKNGLPSEEDGRRLVIENEPHRVDGFNGVIKEGYGKGRKALLYDGPVVVKIGGKTSVQRANYHFHEAEKAGPHYDLAITGVPSQQFSLRPRKFEINFCQGPLAGRRFAVVNTIMKEGEGGRMIVPQTDRGVRLDKPDYRLKDLDWLKKEVVANPGKYVVETKADGSLANAAVHNFRVAFRSHREGGETYYDKLPAVEFIQNQSRLFTNRFLFPGPKLNGTVFKGELVHDQGPAKTAGVLNSSPAKAIAWQKQNGPVKFFVWDLAKYRGRDLSNKTYAERRELLEKTVGEIRHFNRNWQVIEKMPAWQNPADYFRKVIARKGPMGEGIVVKEASNPENWFKVKRSLTADLELVDVVQGQGKYAGSAGALVVKSPTGAIGEVGSFGVPDSERAWIWENREMLKGSTVMVKAMELTSERQVPRAGVFVGFNGNKSPAAVAARGLGQ